MAGEKKKTEKKPQSQKGGMLPSQTTKPQTSISDLSMLIYGPSKIGKSTFCSRAEGAIFLATEPGLNHLEVYQTQITDWQQFLDVCGEIARGDHNFKTVVIDTVDNLYKMVELHICEKFKIEHPSDFEFGKGYGFINNEFSRVLTKLAMLPYGLMIISHSQEKDIKTKRGKRTRVVPTVPEGCRKFLVSLVDLILFCEMQGGEGPDAKASRVIKTKPAHDYDAGDRTGKLPEQLPLNYKIFAQALLDEQPAEEKPKDPDTFFDD